MRKKKKGIFIGIALLSLSFSIPAYAGNTTIVRDNYTKKFQSNWCWAATGKNFVVAIEGNKTKPSNEKQQYELYKLVNAVKEGDEPDPIGSYLNDYNGLNKGGGLIDSCDIASEYCDLKGYTHEFGYMNDTVRYAFFVSDVERFGWPYGIRLSPTDKTPSVTDNVTDHIVLACGVNNLSGQRVTLYDSEDGTYITMNYDDFKNGNSSAFSYRKYEGTMFCND